ncbi:MAG: hypothetical protein GX561_07180 [Lentisphaerae bacterium]|nr:hypothetical protein [Lentisphaerota bacterium]
MNRLVIAVVFVLCVGLRGGVAWLGSHLGSGDGLYGKLHGIVVLDRYGDAVGRSRGLLVRGGMLLSGYDLSPDVSGCLSRMVCSGDRGMLDELSVDGGGWCCEVGGCFDFHSSLGIMRFGLDLSLLHREEFLRALGAVESELCIGENDLRLACQLLEIYGLGRASGFVSLIELHGRVNGVREFFLGCVDENGLLSRDGVSSVYDTALVVRGLCLLGYREDCPAMVAGLIRQRQDDGRWEDATVGDDALVTSVVVEALAGYDGYGAGIEVELDDSMLGADGFVEVRVTGDVEGILGMEVSRGGELIDVVQCAGDDGVLRWFQGTHPSGEYHLNVVVWSNEGFHCLFEERLSVTVEGKYVVERLQWEGAALERMVFSGRWQGGMWLAWEQWGNCVRDGTVGWELETEEGMVVCSSSSEIRMEAGTRTGRFPVDLKDDSVDLDAGNYLLHGYLKVGEDSRSCVCSLVVVDGIALEVENLVESPRIPVGASEVGTILRIRRREGSMIGGRVPVGFTVPGGMSRVEDSTRGWVPIEFDGVVDALGMLVKNGWLIVQGHYGSAEADVEFSGGGGGFACGVEIREGRGEMLYCGEGSGVIGTVVLSVYQGYESEGVLCRGRRLGVVEVALSEACH